MAASAPGDDGPWRVPAIRPRRRFPPWLGRVLLPLAGRARVLAGRASRHWQRSLQLRVVGVTLVISAVVVAVLGFFLLQQIANGLLNSARKGAITQTMTGLETAQAPQEADNLRVSPAGQLSLVTQLQAGSGPGNLYYVAIVVPPGQQNPVSGVLSTALTSASIPLQLQQEVTRAQRSGHTGRMFYQPTSLTTANGKGPGPALVVGVPIPDNEQLYYVFPLTQQQQSLRLVQTTVISAGIALVLLLAVIVSLVTRWVVLPIRQAARAARRLSGGNLEERMPVRGTDELAALADSFNEMASSLEDKIRELQDLSQVQRQFVSDVSHELRTPLTTIRVAADVLFEARSQLDAPAGRSAELLQGQLGRFEALLSDLLEISRYDANVATLDAESADVCDLVRRAAADAEQLAARVGTRITFQFPPGPCFAEVDRRRVERVLRNLLDNAVEHGEAGDVEVTVAADRDAVAVAVRDHGVGLGPGEHALVFDRFWRADPARARTTGGTGLGLAIALEDARLHGGWLQAWGERGRGSVFRLTLPRTVGAELVGSPLPLGPDESEPAAVRGGLWVVTMAEQGGQAAGPPAVAGTVGTGPSARGGDGGRDGEGGQQPGPVVTMDAGQMDG